MAKDLREIYAEEYNEAALKLQKKDVLHTYLINEALKSFPSSDKNYRELYKRYKKLKESGDMFSEEYNKLSKLFRNQINDIRDFIVKLSDSHSLEQFEDRVYYLASKKLIDIPIEPIDKLPVKKVLEEDLREYVNKTDELSEKLRKYESEGKDMNDVIDEMERWNDEHQNYLKIERYYMRKEKEIVLKKEGLELYPKVFSDILKVKKQIEKEIYIEQKLNEYMETNPNSALYWAKVNGEYPVYVFDVLLKWANTSSNKELPSLVNSIKDFGSGQTQQVFKVTDFSPLSPYFIDLIEIENFIFPNVMYYIYYKLFQSIADVILKEEKEPINGSVWSHNMLMLSARGEGYSRDPKDYKVEKDVSSLYSYMEGVYLQVVLKNRASKALYNKFKDGGDIDSQLNKLLISSNPNVLVYNDNNDSILGSGPINEGRFQGINLIGEIMMQIRDELSNKYGRVVIEDVNISPPKAIAKENAFIISDYMYEKTREMLYVFMIYSLYIKNSRNITLDNSKFVIDKIYNKIYDNLKKIEKQVKIPRIDNSFQKLTDEFLDQNKFKINRDAMSKLWSYIYILNEMMNYEVEEDNLPLFKMRKLDVIETPIEYEDIKDFISNIEYEPQQLFIDTVNEKIKKYGTNICVGLGLTYLDNGKRKKSEVSCKNINKDKLVQNYLQLAQPLLLKIKDNVKYESFYIVIYSSNIDLLRAEYVTNIKSKCKKLLKDSDDNINCVFDTYINILSKLKKNNDIVSITGNSIAFVNSLLSTVGSQNITNKDKKISPSSDEDLSKNSVILNILSNRTGLSITNKYEGVYAFDPTYNIMIGDFANIVPIENTNKFVCQFMVELLRKDRQLVETYMMNYDNKEKIFSVTSKGDNIGIKFSIKNDRIIYSLPSDIYFDMTSFTIRYQVVSYIKSANLLALFNYLSKTTDSMSRVLSFSDYSYEQVGLYKEGEEEEEEEEEEEDLINKLKKNIPKKGKEEEEEEEEVSKKDKKREVESESEEDEGVSEEEVDEHMHYEGEKEDEEEEGEEEYYDDDE